MRADNIEAPKTHPLGPLGLLAEASVAHPVGRPVRLLQADRFLLAVFMTGGTPEASKTHPLVLLGHLAEASVARPEELSVHLLQADQVLLAVFMMGVTRETSVAVAASGVHTEEVVEAPGASGVHTEGVMEEEAEEATGKLIGRLWIFF